MPKTKKPNDRLFQINNYFNRRLGSRSVVTAQELMEHFGIRRAQLFKDFRTLKKDMEAPLEYDRTLRGYRYTAPFLISDRITFTHDELTHLRIGVELLSRMKHFRGFGQLPATFQKIRQAVVKWSMGEPPHKPVYFDPLPEYEGGRHLDFFYQAIENQQQVQFGYKNFRGGQPKTVVFDPYFLRHYDRRWYLGGHSHYPGEDMVRTFPLERMQGQPAFTGYSFKLPAGFSAEGYWRHIYGITVPGGRPIETVVVEFRKPQHHYFLSSPFFEPFEVLEESTEKAVVSSRLKPNIDLLRKLASLGAGVKVLRPASLVEDIKMLHEAAAKIYELD